MYFILITLIAILWWTHLLSLILQVMKLSLKVELFCVWLHRYWTLGMELRYTAALPVHREHPLSVLAPCVYILFVPVMKTSLPILRFYFMTGMCLLLLKNLLIFLMIITLSLREHRFTEDDTKIKNQKCHCFLKFFFPFLLIILYPNIICI
jgi:hypothetical protein